MNVSNAVFNGMVAGDALSVTANGTFGSANVARNAGNTVIAQTVSYTNTLGGADAGNYSYNTGTQTTSAKITPKSLTLVGLTANDKPYDGSSAATISSFGTLTGVVTADASYVSLNTSGYTASFASKNVAYASGAVTSQAVTVAANTLVLGAGASGNLSGNYTIETNPTTTATINPKSIYVTNIAANDKVYDGTPAATVNVTGATFNGIVGSDVLTVAATGSFADVGGVANTAKNVGTTKTVTLSSTYGGVDRNNYTITGQATTTANITLRTLNVTATASNKTYDAGRTAKYLENAVNGEGPACQAIIERTMAL